VGSRRLLVCLLVGAVITSGVAQAAPTRTRRARVAVKYLVSQQKANGSIPAFSAVGSTADAVVSMVAARRGAKAIDKAIGWLRKKVRNGKVDSLGPKAKVVLAVAAAGKNPRSFGGADLIGEIQESELENGRFGEITPVFDQALALLALQGAGASFTTKSVEWLVDAQCGDGGWQFDEPATEADDEHCFSGDDTDFFLSDTNTTSLVVQVLGYIEESPPQPATDPFQFFNSIRDDLKKGWGYSWGFETTDANSTALVLQAYAAQGTAPPAGARKALAELQYGFCSKNRGAFAFTWTDEDGDGKYKRSGPDLGATVGAIMGLTETPFWFGGNKVSKSLPKLKCR
jgi:hypothetical protein